MKGSFKKGDIIIATTDRYSITNKGWMGEVLGEYTGPNADAFNIRVTNLPNHNEFTGGVDSYFFALVKENMFDKLYERLF